MTFVNRRVSFNILWFVKKYENREFTHLPPIIKSPSIAFSEKIEKYGNVNDVCRVMGQFLVKPSDKIYLDASGLISMREDQIDCLNQYAKEYPRLLMGIRYIRIETTLYKLERMFMKHYAPTYACL